MATTSEKRKTTARRPAPEPEYRTFKGLRLLVRPNSEMRRRRSTWEGAVVKTLERIENRGGAMPAGSYWLVLRNRGGLELVSLPCRCCGFQLRVLKVGESSVEYLGHVTDEKGRIPSGYFRPDATRKLRINGPEPPRAGT